MKDRVEFRFTIATGRVDSKALRVLGKAVEKKLDRVIESVVKAAEAIVESGVENLKGEEAPKGV